MTKQEYINKYNESFDFTGLHCAMIFHYDPILEVVECRNVYSTSRMEVSYWLEKATKFYKNNKVPFVGYLDGCFEESYGEINNYLEKEDKED